MCVCMYVYIYIYTYIHTHTFTPLLLSKPRGVRCICVFVHGTLYYSIVGCIIVYDIVMCYIA